MRGPWVWGKCSSHLEEGDGGTVAHAEQEEGDEDGDGGPQPIQLSILGLHAALVQQQVCRGRGSEPGLLGSGQPCPGLSPRSSSWGPRSGSGLGIPFPLQGAGAQTVQGVGSALPLSWDQVQRTGDQQSLLSWALPREPGSVLAGGTEPLH